MSEVVGKWSLNLQTLVLLGSIAGVLASGGYMFSGLQTDTDRNSAAVSDLSRRMERNDSKTDLNEARIAALEKVAADAVTLRRQLEGTLGEFRSDIAVIKEILERMDRNKEPKP